MRIEAVRSKEYTLGYVPGNLKTQKMCNDAVRNNPAVFFLVPDCFKAEGMCHDAVEVDPWQLYDVPGHLKKQEFVSRPLNQTLFPCNMFPTGGCINE